jgi:putative FmdB family regulatory protein
LVAGQTEEQEMPTYEYRCTSCGEHLEVVQGFRDEPLTECTLCGGPLRKVFGSVGIVFKGSGFYKTDSRSSSKVSSNGSPKSDAAKSDTTSTSSSDTSAPSSGSDSSTSKPSEKSSSTVAAAS